MHRKTGNAVGTTNALAPIERKTNEGERNTRTVQVSINRRVSGLGVARGLSERRSGGMGARVEVREGRRAMLQMAAAPENKKHFEGLHPGRTRASRENSQRKGIIEGLLTRQHNLPRRKEKIGGGKEIVEERKRTLRTDACT